MQYLAFTNPTFICVFGCINVTVGLLNLVTLLLFNDVLIAAVKGSKKRPGLHVFREIATTELVFQLDKLPGCFSLSELGKREISCRAPNHTELEKWTRVFSSTQRKSIQIHDLSPSTYTYSQADTQRYSLFSTAAYTHAYSGKHPTCSSRHLSVEKHAR